MNQVTQLQIIIIYFRDKWRFGFSLQNDGASDYLTFDILTTWTNFSSYTSEDLSMSVFNKKYLLFFKFSGLCHHKSFHAKSSTEIPRDSKSARFFFAFT